MIEGEQLAQVIIQLSSLLRSAGVGGRISLMLENGREVRRVTHHLASYCGVAAPFGIGDCFFAGVRIFADPAPAHAQNAIFAAGLGMDYSGAA